MSPAETLRAAAAKVRDTASNATPGPWECDGIGDYGWTVRDVSPFGTFAIETEDSEQGQADAEWIALMSPAVAEPLAAHLERLADMALLTGAPVMREALALARKILGRSS